MDRSLLLVLSLHSRQSLDRCLFLASRSLEAIGGQVSSSWPIVSLEAIGGLSLLLGVSLARGNWLTGPFLASRSLEAIDGPVSSSKTLASLEAFG